MGGKGTDPTFVKNEDNFFMAQSLQIFNKKFHRIRDLETFKLWSNFESFHSSCLMRFFVENWQRKNALKDTCPGCVYFSGFHNGKW